MGLGSKLAMTSLLAATAACGAARPAPPPTLAYAVVAPQETKAESAPVDLTSAIDDVRTDAPAKDDKADDERRIADGVPDANLSAPAVGSGVFAIADVSCHADDGIGALPKVGALAKPFADRKRLLDRCAKGNPHEARIRWRAVGGRMDEVEVISGANLSNRCIERVLRGARVPIAGTCAATLEVGVAQRR